MTKTIPDMIAAHELAVYAENDRDIYFQAIRPVVNNLSKKVKRGTYDHTKAIKAWEHVATAAAMKYNKEFGTPGASYYTMFNAATRRAAATELAENFEILATPKQADAINIWINDQL